MPDGELASWVEPIARRDREARAALIEIVRAVPSGVWLRGSPLPDWTYKDLLAHLAGDTGKWFSYILSSVLDGEAFDPQRAGPPADIDALNRRDVADRQDRPVTELVEEIESDGQEHQKLLSRLSDKHRDYRMAAYSVSLSEFLSTNPAGSRGAHDDEHGTQLRTAWEGA